MKWNHPKSYLQFHFTPPRKTRVLLWSSYPACSNNVQIFGIWPKKTVANQHIRFPLGVTVGQSSFLQADKPGMKQE